METSRCEARPENNGVGSCEKLGKRRFQLENDQRQMAKFVLFGKLLNSEIQFVDLSLGLFHFT